MSLVVPSTQILRLVDSTVKAPAPRPRTGPEHRSGIGIAPASGKRGRGAISVAGPAPGDVSVTAACPRSRRGQGDGVADERTKNGADSAVVIVVTGPIASGKSTTARVLAQELARRNVRTAVIDLDLLHDMLTEVGPKSDETT